MLGTLDYLVDHSLLFIYWKVKSRAILSENMIWVETFSVKTFEQELSWFHIPAFAEALYTFGDDGLMWSCAWERQMIPEVMEEWGIY